MFKRFGRLSLGSLLALSLISHASVVKANLTSNALIELVEGPKRSTKVTPEFWYKAYLNAASHGIAWTNTFQKRFGGKPLFCPRDDWALKPNENYRILKDYIKARPEYGSKPVVATLVIAYMTLYPCE